MKKNNIIIKGLFRKEENPWQISGDPTEGALLVLAAKGGLWREQREKKEKRVYEIPFDSERKRMSVVYEDSWGKVKVYTKGAPDVILEKCKYVMWEGRVTPLTKEIKQKILTYNDKMAEEALGF